MKNLFQTTRLIILIILLLSEGLILSGQSGSKSLEAGFKTPPPSAKPRTWWHWTNSNVTTGGITRDLEWMSRAGIGGFQLADVASGQGQTVDKKVLFGTPEWYEAVRHAASEAARLNLEMSIFSSPGWSLTGGPWVKQEQAMKKLVWSELQVKGPMNFSEILPAPPSNEGPIRNMSRAARISPQEIPFYKDCIVLAFPTPPDETSAEQYTPVITTSNGSISGQELLDDDLNTSTTIKAGKDKKVVWLQFSYDKPFKAQALTLASRNGIPTGSLQVSENGTDFNTIALFPGTQLYRAGKVETISFPPVSSRFYRLVFTGAPMRPAEVMDETPPRPDSLYNFTEVKLHPGARINRWEDKAGYFHLFNYDPVSSGEVAPSAVINPSSIINLTREMASDGALKWKVPPGNWTILRFGYSLTGSKNRPAVPTGSGYEVDKLSREDTEDYIKNYTDPLVKALGPLYGKSLQYVLIDSWEAGMQNWTDNMLKEFSERRGYDPSPYLPCMAGRVVGNSELSDRFLWDFRRTLADMFAENHYKVITEYLHKQGIKTYGEASGVSLEILEDALLCKKYVDIPMGEFWYRALHPELMYYQDVRGAASASHIYGKKLVAAESFTGGGYESPYTLKKIGDYWFTQGINRIVFHTSAHQPLDTKPGNTMVGTHINRNITWAEEATPFMTYLARNSYMLQQGKFVADLVYLLDEGAPSTMPIWGTGLIPAPPEGYDYDYINADALTGRMSVSADGRLILPDSMSYAVLVLPNTVKMTLPVLQKIHELVKNGASILGPKPAQTPGLTGYPESEKNLAVLVNDLWGDLDGVSRTRRTFGKGKVFWNVPVATVLASAGVEPDFEYVKPIDAKLNWIHRRSGNTDIWFIVNTTGKSFDTEVRLRTAGKIPELWDPADGVIKNPDYLIVGNKTTIPLHFSEYQSVFVVFRNKSEASTASYPHPELKELLTLTGPWQVSFPPDLGAPENITVDQLGSWTMSQDDGIKYFSGTATYSKTFEAPKSWFHDGAKFIIDLGDVGDLAEVSVNGFPAGILWKSPFRADITGFVKKGNNRIEIKVTNEWTNRLMGDQNLPADKKILKSGIRIFGARSLNDSGLMGPVNIYTY